MRFSIKRLPLRSQLLFVSIAVGMLLPGGHVYAFLIRYAVMAMLFLSLLDCRISLKLLLHPHLWRLLGMMGGIAIATFALFRLVSADLALIAFLLAVTPTATAAPVVTRFLQGQVDYVTASVILTNGLMALAIPLVLPLLSDSSSANMGQILNATLVVIAAPLVLSQVLIRTSPKLSQQLTAVKDLSFYLWLLALLLASSRTSHFILYESGNWNALPGMALVALVLCALNFGVGHWLGRPTMAQETSQSLGQKNTMLAIWLCLTFLNPQMALGPMFYVLFQNVYNSYLIAGVRKG
ncbi:MAG: hypothetical protein ICV62_06325 [Cyanobacteria bacterium Co-bin13]|nr:hypothetical protein [Cyanobacteria bacterium Co-bin13]